jgi:hypothetical protein
VGNEHLCNYLLNIRYITLCLFPQGFWFSFLIELFWLWDLEYCTSFGFTHKFWLLARVSASRNLSLSKFHLLLHSHVCKFGVYIIFCFFFHSSWCLSRSRVWIFADVIKCIFHILDSCYYC